VVRKIDGCFWSSRKALVLVAAIVVVGGFTAISWRYAIKLNRDFSSTEYRDYCPPGLFETVQAIKAIGVSEVFGPDPACWSYAHQRLSEMLYPIDYNTTVNLESLDSGAIFVLFPDQLLPAKSSIILQVGDFRVMKVSP